MKSAITLTLVKIETFFHSKGFHVRINETPVSHWYSVELYKDLCNLNVVHEFSQLTHKVFVNAFPFNTKAAMEELLKNYGVKYVYDSSNHLVTFPPDFVLCRSCGCSDHNAFSKGKVWAELDLCSDCQELAAEGGATNG